MFRLITKYIKAYRIMFVSGSLAKLAEAVLELYLPVLMAGIIDYGIVSGDRGFIYTRGLQLIGVAFTGLMFALFCQYSAAVVSTGTGLNIRNAVFKHITTLSYAELDRLDTSTLVNRITSDVNYVQTAVAYTIRLVSRAPFLCVGAVIMALRIDVMITLIFLAIIPILGLILFLFFKLTPPMYTRAQKKLDGLAKPVKENLSGVRVIRAFSNTDKEEARFYEAAESHKNANIFAAGVSALMNPATSIVVNMATIAILYIGASRVYGGYLSQGNVLALCSYASKILYALIIVANLAVLFTKASTSSARINEVLDTAPSVIFTDGGSGEKNNGNAFEFRNVSFSYNGVEKALDGISFTVKSGATLGIIGVTGSGKTTLINLLQRFYDVTDGEILINGTPIKSLPKRTLRQGIGVAPQNAVLFSGSIADNMRLACEDASDDSILEALATAQAMDFIDRMEDGINTKISEGGKNLSGGQRQRLAIARALVKKPPLLILDDSLSALDYKTDLLLRKGLREKFGGNTTIVIISQRISSVQNADSILVLDEGTIKGIGTHGQLLKDCPIYKDIYESLGGTGSNG